ncbi:uncharacterized protein RJT20DRAFT_131183 [Scheffersomyces xylosifermentans]|uniref:uncharacterized protein n=1 Tax=Scheffersomyces xylosifermentans TaxID=1304137 RepID=UPI00315E022F
MSTQESLRKSMQAQVDQQQAAEALRIANQSAQHHHQHHQQHNDDHHQHQLLMQQQHQQQVHQSQQQQQQSQGGRHHHSQNSLQQNPLQNPHQHHQQHSQQQSQMQQQQQHQRQNQHQHLQHHQQHSFHPQAQQHQQIQKESESFPELTEYDLKSRDSKYRRWTPKMDQFLIKLLSDVVHSYPKGAEAEMTKKAWAYVTGQLRTANPETVYSTYTKYSCQQHLMNVNHHRYKIWYVLMLHQKNNPAAAGYSYRWNPDLGRFQIIDNSTGSLILDERQVKSLLYSESLSLPSLSAFNKGNLIVNDFFLSDNLKYMSVYHNEVLPLLIRLDSKYAEGLGDIYSEIPKFDYHEGSLEYFKPLVPAKAGKLTTIPNQNLVNKAKKRSHSETSNSDISLPFSKTLASIATDGADTDVSSQHPTQDEDSVDPALKRNRALQDTPNAIDFENALASAAIAAINSPPVTNGGRDNTPYYIKDRKWFNKLINLHESGHIGVEDVLSVCEGVRDGKIPLFMLNVLDQSYYQTRNNSGLSEELPDEETAKRIREFMLPMVYN